MFDKLAPNYDFLNRVNSFGLDLLWRKELVRRVAQEKPRLILDLAAGTGDVSIALAEELHRATIVAADLSLGMLEHAVYKSRKAKVDKRVKIAVIDGTDMAFPDNHFDAVTCAFGIRNFEDISIGYQEIYRVLKPGGMVAILELCEPSNPLLNTLYQVHAGLIIPSVSSLSGNREAYKYLGNSIRTVPNRALMEYLMKSTGFEYTHYKVFTPGVCALYIGYKPSFQDELAEYLEPFDRALPSL